MAERRFTVRIDAEMGIGNVASQVQKIQTELNKLTLPQDMSTKISGTFSKLTSEIEKFQAMSAKGINSTQDFNQLATSGNKIIQIYEQLANQVKSLGNLSNSQLQKLFPASVLNNIQKATNAMNQYEQTAKNTQSEMSTLVKEIEEAKNKTSQLVKQKEKLEKKTALSDTTFAQLGKDAEEAKKKFEEAQAKLIELQQEANNVTKYDKRAKDNPNYARSNSVYRELVDKTIPAQEAEVAKLEQAWTRVENKKNKALSQSVKDASIAKLIADIEKAEGNVTELQNKLNTLKAKDSSSFQNLITQLNQINGINLDPATVTIQEIQQAISRLSSTEIENLKRSFSNFGVVVENSRSPIQNFGSNIDATRGKVKQLDQTMSEVDMLKSRINYFFGLTNSVYLLKRAINSALTTVKELDAVMTETAVVTEFSVGDMWGKLPEYSAEATKLGASIKDLYSATTLYYQQGLQTEAAMGVGIETMKMARIAGMEAAQATEAMTAALRGFNMEVNEANAVRVNDVYSELAAITAADTEQIATAMSKTASIAASANMEFETTAALLAQIIETTQEAPETAGTALKTIIARFSEVKKLREKGEASGEDEEGEIIDVNKIQGALRTVGISMDDFFAGAEGLDSILLKLAGKWNTLDFETQRYIATTAAGSRQQSRFIAMMSDYERTMELATAANNSAGASQQQFDKTLESMEAKLQKLKNAWNEFLMGLSNNEVLKGGIDLLTSFLTSLNKITSSLSGGNGLVKSILTLTTVLGALKGGKALLGGGLSWMGSQMGINQKGKNSFTQQIFSGSRKEGERAGQQAGTGFIAGVRRTIQQGSSGVGTGIKSFFGQSINGLDDAMYAQTQDGKWNADKTQIVRQVYKTEGIDAAKNKFIELGGSVDNAEKMVSQFNLDLQNVGFAALAAGGAIRLFASMAEKAGNEKLSEALNKISTGFTAFGGILMMLGPIFNSVGGIAIKAGGKIAIAGWTSQLAWWWIFAIIAAVALLTVGIVKLAQAAKKASLEGRMEAAAEATKDAQAAAEDAKEAYDNLLSSKNEYQELQSGLEGLTKGTDEWCQALMEVNQQVLQLLATYPQLAQYLSKGEEGQLIIEDEGWDQLVADQERSMLNAQAAAVSSRIRELNLEQEKATQDFQKNFRSKDSYYDSAGWINVNEGDQISTESAYDQGFVFEEATMNKMLKAYEIDPEKLFEIKDTTVDLSLDSSYSEELQAIAAESDYTAQELWNMKEALIDYNAALLQNEIQLQKQAEATLYATSSQETKDYKYGDDIITAFAKATTTEAYTEKEQENTDLVYGKDGASEWETNTDFQALAKEYKVTNKMVGDDLKDLRTLYAAMAGIAIEDIPEGIAEDKKRLAEEIGKMQTAEETREGIEDFRKKMQVISERDQSDLATLISGDASNLTAGQLTELSGKKAIDYADELGYAGGQEMAEALGYADDRLAKLSFEDQKAYIDNLKAQDEEVFNQQYGNYIDENGNIKYTELANAIGSQVVTAEVQFNIDTQQAQEKIQETYDKSIGAISEKTEMDDVATKLANSSVGVISNISKQISNMSQEDAKKYVEGWTQIINSANLEEGQREQLENYLSNIDWSNMTEAVEAMDYMQSMGIDSSIMKKYWNAATNGANTYISSLQEALSLTERLQKRMQSVNDIKKNLTEGTASYEDMMELVEAGADISTFQLTSEGWKATAEQIEVATDKLKEYNAEQARAIADQQKEQLKDAQNVWNKYKDSETAQLNKLTTQNEDGTLTAGTIETTQQASGIAYSLGLEKKAAEETEDQFIIRIQEAYDSYIALLNNGEDIQIIAEKQAVMAEAARYSSTENEMGEAGKYYKDASGNIVQGEGRAAGSEESVLYSTQNDATEAGLKADEMMKYAEQLQNVHAGLTKVNAAQIALANSKLNAGLAEIIESYDTWTKLIDKKSGLIKATSSDDIEAFNKLKAATNKMLNTSEDLSDAFWKSEKNMKNLKKAAQGNTEALEELQKAAASDYLQNLDLQLDKKDMAEAEKSIDDFTKYLENIEIPKLEAGVEWRGEDANKFIDNFNNMAEAANLSAQQIQNAVKSMGFDAEIEYVEQTRKLPIYSQTEKKIDNGDGTATIESGTPVITGYEEVTGLFPVVKTLTASGAGGGGVSTKNKEAGKANKKKGGGGGGGSKKKNWENPYDKQYNLVQKINAELRKREKLERRYQELLARSGTTASQLQKNTEKEVAAVKQEMKYREQLLGKRKEEMKDLENKYKKYEKYAYYDEETGEVVINWEEINKIKDTDLGEAVEKYISDLEKKEDEIKSEEDALEEQTEILRAIYDRGKDEYFDLEDQIKEALINERQQEIDKLSAINDSINDTNSRLIDAMQSSIDKYRQDRENERTEEELSDKQRRLAYLQQDTSGANALEIMQLQEEIDQGMEDYTDQLIDQKINELQEQNDKAAEQREKQIAIAEAQLKKWEESGEVWDEVYKLMEEGLVNGGVKAGSDLERLLKEGSEFEAKSALGQMQWQEDIENLATAAQNWIKTGNSIQAQLDTGRIKAGKTVTFTTKDGQEVTGTVQKDGTIKTSTGEIYKGVYQNYDGSYITDENFIKPKSQTSETPTPQTPTPTINQDKKIKVGGKINAKGAKIYGYIGGEGQTQYFKNDPIYKVLDEKNGYLKVRHHKLSSGVSGWFKKKDVKAYKTGGLADFTGPAWLDGTKSKPEYILNAEQTKSFFELVDVLGSLKNGTSQSSQITGDSIYDVDINVESIGSDYDVEKLATTIKRMINDDARYRNNNAINLQR